MEDFMPCELCSKKQVASFPHHYMTLISRIPESSIYRCQQCRTFWMCSNEFGWENLDFDSVWDIAS